MDISRDILSTSNDTHWELKKSVARKLLSRRGILNVHIDELNSNFERVKIFYFRLPEKQGLVARLLGNGLGPYEECEVTRNEFVSEMEIQAGRRSFSD